MRSGFKIELDGSSSSIITDTCAIQYAARDKGQQQKRDIAGADYWGQLGVNTKKDLADADY
jgi:hypothetical protein